MFKKRVYLIIIYSYTRILYVEDYMNDRLICIVHGASNFIVGSIPYSNDHCDGLECEHNSNTNILTSNMRTWVRMFKNGCGYVIRGTRGIHYINDRLTCIVLFMEHQVFIDNIPYSNNHCDGLKYTDIIASSYTIVLNCNPVDSFLHLMIVLQPAVVLMMMSLKTINHQSELFT